MIKGLKSIIFVARLLIFTLIMGAFSSNVFATEYAREDTVIFDLRMDNVPDPEIWNPYIRDVRVSKGLSQAMMEPLFIYNYETGNVIPWLAEKYTMNETGDVWTINLREGIRWSDGQSMDADDVVFTINLLKNTDGLSFAPRVGDWVENIKKIDNLTVQFQLKRPNPRFLQNQLTAIISSSLNILPEHIWKDKDPLTFKNYNREKGWPVFTGPYKLASISNTRFVYTRDDNWWGAKAGFRPLPRPKQLIWVDYGAEETRAAAMVNHDLDSLGDIEFDAYSSLRMRNSNVISHYKELPFAWIDVCPLTFELNNDIAPWNDKELRWALNYAINRNEVISQALDGTSIPAYSIFPAYGGANRLSVLAEGQELFNKYPIENFDPDLAREIIEEKGYSLDEDGEFYQKDGKILSIHIETQNTSVQRQNIVRVIVEQLRRVSINATMGVIDIDSYLSRLIDGSFEARLSGQSCVSSIDPWTFLHGFNISHYKPIGEKAGPHRGSAYNGWRWRNKEYSAIVDEMGTLSSADDGRFDTLLIKAMDIWMDELPIIPITHTKRLMPFDTSYWTNWPTAENAYIQPAPYWHSALVIIHNLKQSKKPVEKISRKRISERIQTITAELPPFSYSENEIVKGVSTEVVNNILKYVGVTPDIETYPWARAQFMAAQQTPNILIYPILRLPDVEDKFKWVGAITPIKTYIFKNKSSANINIRNIDDLQSYRIGVVRESGAHHYLETRGIENLTTLTRMEQALMMLDRDRLDLVVASQLTVSTLAKNLDISFNNYEKVVEIEELSTDAYLAFSQNTSAEIVSQFREALAKTYSTGQYTKILEDNRF